MTSGEMFINKEQCKFDSYKQIKRCFSTITEFYYSFKKKFMSNKFL